MKYEKIDKDAYLKVNKNWNRPRLKWYHYVVINSNDEDLVALEIRKKLIYKIILLLSIPFLLSVKIIINIIDSIRVAYYDYINYTKHRIIFIKTNYFKELLSFTKKR